jgi:hypothetical protein
MCRGISDHLADEVGFVRATGKRVCEDINLSRNLYKAH